MKGETMEVYVASSWRNQQQPDVVRMLRAAGHAVYDYKHPTADSEGFHWSEIDPDWKDWTREAFRTGLEHDIARLGFGCDMAALKKADACVLVLPCGRSAHLEAGWAKGAGKFLVILLTDTGPLEPELMYAMADRICLDLADVVEALRLHAEELERRIARPARSA